jgi:D-alanine-D-alanine ligase
MSLRVLHLVGSAVSDFYADLSRLYAAGCLAALDDPRRYEHLVAYVTPDGRWRFPADLGDAAVDAAEPMSVAEAVARLDRLRPDVGVPQMFCLPGMTTYRGLLEVLGIRYVGNRPDVMAIAADKANARAVVAAAGVAVPTGELLRPGESPTLPPPVVVKPVLADNSLGLSLVRSVEEYPAALATAFEHSPRVLVETYVPLGREVRCGIVVRDGELVPLPLEEYAVDPDRKPIRDHADKIRRTGGDLELVAKDTTRAWIVAADDPINEPVWDLARRSHDALGCRDYSLFDVRVDPAGKPWFLEASLYCSFSPQSVLVMMAAAAGLPLDALFAELVASAGGAGDSATRPRHA